MPFARAGALVAAALLFGTIAIALGGHAEDLRDRPFPRPAGGVTRAVPLARLSPDSTTFALPFRATRGRVVTEASEIDIAFATGGPTRAIDRGTLRAGSCLFLADAPDGIVNNALVRFRKAGPCAAASDEPLPLRLIIGMPAGDALFVWSVDTPTDLLLPDAIQIETEDGRTRGVLQGRYVEWRAPSNARRATLLKYAWQIASPRTWIAWVLVAAAILFVGGAFVLIHGTRDTRSSHAGVGVSALFTGSIALALALCYVVVVPPFQAPDEPDHFLGFAGASGRPDLETEAAALARLGHLNRIAFHADERLRPIDVDHPYPIAWGPDVFALPIGGRSRTTQAVWSSVSPWVAGWPAPPTLLLLRLVNAILLALALAAGSALIAWQARDRTAAIAVPLGLLLVPTLPFFGTYVSEGAILTATYAFFACVVAAAFLDTARSHWLGLPLGVSMALILAGGRSGGPVLAIGATALVARSLLGTRDDRDTSTAVRHAAIFWIGAAVGALPILLACGDEYTRGLWPGDTGRLPEWFRTAAELVRQRGWLFAAALPLGIPIEAGAWILRRSRASGRALQTQRIVLRWLMRATVAAMGAVAVASLFVQLPTAQYLDPRPRPTLLSYVQHTLIVVLTSARLRHPDVLLTTLFWGTFGWIDTPVPDALIVGLVMTTAAMGAWLMLRIAARADRRRAAWLVLLVSGAVASIAAAAVANYFINRSLHGRYLLGIYVTLIAVAWTAPSLAARTTTDPQPSSTTRRWATGLLLACAGAHAVALATIIRRYF